MYVVEYIIEGNKKAPLNIYVPIKKAKEA